MSENGSFIWKAGRNDLDWHGTWDEYAINAEFLENYWNQGSWEAEVAADAEGKEGVWRSKPVAGENTGLTIDSGHGSFTGSRANQTDLAPGGTHWLRVRAAGQPEWSPWHAPFARPKL